MKIAILGSAPSSLALAPIGDTSWRIWGCSPGVYATAARCDAWFELHRWEPGVVGVASSQKTWFSPEYVQWMGMRDPRACPVWMYEPVPQIPASRRLPIEALVKKYGSFFLTSSISIMICCAIEDILEERRTIEAAGMAQPTPDPTNGCSTARPTDVIGLFGVDMAATEEYGYQRAGCQHFLVIAANLGIHVHVPPESDLLRPMPIYGICEHSHWHIKNTVRMRELQGRKAQAEAMVTSATGTVNFLNGAIDDLTYQMTTWQEDRDGMGEDPELTALMPNVRAAVLRSLPAPQPPHPAIALEGELVTLLTGIGQRREGEDTLGTVRRLLLEREHLLEKRRPPPKKRRR